MHYPWTQGPEGTLAHCEIPMRIDPDMIDEWGDSHEGDSSDEDILIAQKIKKLMRRMAQHDNARKTKKE